MPTIFVTVPADRLSPERRQALAVEMTDLVATVMRKRREVTSVWVREAGLPGWAIGGAAVDLVAHAEVTVTQGTNTAEEKAEMIRRVNAALAEALPGLPTETYVVVREIAADAWGYGGITQAARAAATPGPSPA